MNTDPEIKLGCSAMLRLLSSACCALLVLPVAAQQKWIVDSANGPGTDFLDIDVAYAASARGDTIIVRSGNGLPYNLPLQIDRSIRIIAPGSSPVPVLGRSRIDSVPLGDVVVVDNLDFATQSYSASLEAVNCRGLVIMSRMYAAPHVISGAGFSFNSDRVVLTRMRNHLPLGTALLANQSRVWLLDSEFSAQYSGDPFLYPFFHGAVCAEASQMWVIGCRAEGGVANPFFQTATPDMALVATSSGSRMFVAGETTLVGAPTLPYRPNYPDCPQIPGRWASVVGSGRYPDPRASMFMYDSNTTFVGCIDPYQDSMQRDFPTVLPGEAIQGQPQSIRVTGPRNAVVSVFASLLHAAPPIELPIGDVWLDPSLVVGIGTGAVDGQRRLLLNTRIPGWLPVGEVLVYQGVSLSPQSLWEISQPGFAVVREP